MKTRQDQIDEMTKLIQAEYEQWLDITGVIPKGSTYYAECMGCAIDSAETLYNAGFGDVKEYKAEIERLKAENKKVYAVRNDLLKENDELIKTNAELLLLSKQAVKQAKIDVLNELKKEYGFYSCFSWGSWGSDVKSLNEIIDELIKEVQK